MCRASTEADGGRRCTKTAATCAQEAAASARYYQRGKARRKIAELADAGIPAVGDDDMPTTYHQHTPDSPVALDGDRPISNSHVAFPDKPERALWSAPGQLDDDGGAKTSWTDWAARNDFGDGGDVVEVSARPGAVIVTLDNSTEAQALMDKYGRLDAIGNRSFDWESMRADGIDGVHVSNRLSGLPAPFSAHGADTPAIDKLYGWDTSSVVWLSTDKLDTGETRTPGSYTAEDSEGSQAYLEPERPDTEGAWGRVPNRFRPAEPKPKPEPKREPESESGSDASSLFTGPAGPSSPLPRRPSTSGGSSGGKGVEAMGFFEMSTAVLKALPKRKKSKKKAAAK